MSSLSDEARRSDAPYGAVVAVEPASGDRFLKAHVVPRSMIELGRHGLTACGFPLDRLRALPDLDWADVELAVRCEHCAGQAPA